MADCIRRLSKKGLGQLKGKRLSEKETWCWIVEVQEVVREKRCCYKAFQEIGNTKNYEIYRRVKVEVKKVVRDAKSKAYNNLYHRLGTREGERFFKLAK